MAEVRCFVSLKMVGFHHWPDAPDSQAYLRHPHRHLFDFTLCWPQEEDRGYEFHDVGNFLQHMILSVGSPSMDEFAVDFGTMSCEAIAQRLAIKAVDGLGLPWAEVSVAEDGENGSVVFLGADDALPLQ